MPSPNPKPTTTINSVDIILGGDCGAGAFQYRGKIGDNNASG
jgi:hypothetical protein